MNDFSLIFEYLALIFLSMTMYFFHDESSTGSFRRNLYWGCLISSLASVVLDIVTVLIDDNELAIPLWANVTLNTLYYLVTVGMTIVIAYYLVRRVYEHSSNVHGLRLASAVLGVLAVAYLSIMLANLGNGMMFYFDEAGKYHRGPLALTTYAAPLVEALLIYCCYIQNNKRVSSAVSRVVRSVPAIVFPILVVQMMFPQLLLNGIYATIINLVIFMSFQSTRVDVDPLTELGNRLSFVNELERRLDLRQDYQVIFVALRSFSQVNQVYGHEAGDLVLYQVAKRLKGVSTSGFAYRVAGDVFALLIPVDAHHEASYVAQLVSDAMQEDWIIESHHVNLPTTTAWLRYTGRDWNGENIISRLEFALAEGKTKKQALVTFDADMANRYDRHVSLEGTMQKAVEEKRFETWFQPIYNHHTGRFDTAEALIRLRDEHGNLVRPDEFIPLAETSELIDRLTWIVLEDSCKLLSSRRVSELKRISVNLTARQLLQRNFAAKMIELLKCYGIEPKSIKLEITERTISENSELAAETMGKLHDMGFDFMMDDFGTGYSNFSTALSMPFSFVKLDRSLLENVTDDPKSHTMASLLIPYFHQLGQDVVAEGIETPEQARCVLDMGVDLIQGYCYARPMDTDALETWYRIGVRPV